MNGKLVKIRRGAHSMIWHYTDAKGRLHKLESHGWYHPWRSPMWGSAWATARWDDSQGWSAGTISNTRTGLIERIDKEASA